MGQTPPPTASWRRYTTAHRCSTLSASSSRRSADSQAPGRGAVFKHDTRGYLKLFPYGAKFLKALPPTVRRSADGLLCVNTSDNDCSSPQRRPGRKLSGDAECRANGPELEAGLLQLGPGVRLFDDAAAGEEPCRRAGELRTAQGDGPFPVAVRIHPTDRPRVPPPIGALQLPD